MKTYSSPIRALAAAITTVTLVPAGVLAQEAPEAWPSRTVTVVVGAGAGGTNDMVARLVADKLSQRLNAKFIVRNAPGAGTSLATRQVARAEPDGYTLLSNSASMTTAPLQFKVDYDTRKDLTPISMFVDAPFVIVAHSSLGVSTLPQFAAYARANPGKVNWGSLAGLQGIGGRWLDHVLGIKTQDVPYREASEMYLHLSAGEHLQASMVQSIAMIQHIRSGALKPLAWTSRERNASLPDTPSMAELGHPDFQVSLWQGLFGPAKMSPALAERISREVAAVAKDPAVVERMSSFGFTTVGSKPADFAQVVSQNLSSWERLVNELGLKLQ
jgi:tripartite-type tricarboxylate transporter receptor subunit TctC